MPFSEYWRNLSNHSLISIVFRSGDQIDYGLRNATIYLHLRANSLKNSTIMPLISQTGNGISNSNGFQSKNLLNSADKWI